MITSRNNPTGNSTEIQQINKSFHRYHYFTAAVGGALTSDLQDYSLLLIVY
ncbi:MAG: hypothetical protein HC920_19725 [Oscillatoriales cyanobacterium SM2_3_0]|nr:hypothetical protein [Oscillatoriales cyanobacterium SM2_3_0]